MQNLDTKESSAVKTVNKIRGCLEKVGIFLFEKAWTVNRGGLFSTIVADIGFEGVGANGKGVSRDAALASGYAEFMERLQNDKMLFTGSYGLMSEQHSAREPEAKVVEADESFFEENRTVFEALFRSEELERVKSWFIDSKRSLQTLPFYSAATNSVKYLPLELLKRCCSSNGMCAGNSAEEALLQGISEIFERYAIREIFYKKLTPPSVDMNEIKGLGVYKVVESLEEAGYRVMVKDCSLGGKVPVVGIVVISQDGSRYRLAFGSHALFEVALERCLTEIFQGAAENQHSLIMHSFAEDEDEREKSRFKGERAVELEFICFIRNGLGRCHESYFASGESVPISDVFMRQFRGNSESMQVYRRLIEQLGSELYIRDVSFLGFPSYYIYLPGLSEVERLDYEGVVNFYNSEEVLKKGLLRLKRCSDEKLAAMSDILEGWYSLPSYFSNRADFLKERLPGISLSSNSDWNLLDFEFLLALINLKLKRYDKAFTYLEQWLEDQGEELDNRAYYNCCLLYCKLKLAGAPDEAVVKELTASAGSETAALVIDSMSSTDRIFDSFILPDCGECRLCPVREDCSYEEWSRVNHKILEKKNRMKIDQLALQKVFGS